MRIDRYLDRGRPRPPVETLTKGGLSLFPRADAVQHVGALYKLRHNAAPLAAAALAQLSDSCNLPERIDVVQLAVLDQGGDGGPMLGAAARTGEQRRARPGDVRRNDHGSAAS
jgi:hypothetical protein